MSLGFRVMSDTLPNQDKRPTLYYIGTLEPSEKPESGVPASQKLQRAARGGFRVLGHLGLRRCGV